MAHLRTILFLAVLFVGARAGLRKNELLRADPSLGFGYNYYTLGWPHYSSYYPYAYAYSYPYGYPYSSGYAYRYRPFSLW